MNQCKKITIWIIILFFNVQTQSAEITVGGQNISISSPPGFIEISSIYPEEFQIIDYMTPPTNRLLAVFLDEVDANLIEQGKEGQLNSYMIVQVVKEIESLNITANQFKELRAVLRTQCYTMFEEHKELFDETADNISEKISTFADEKVDYRIGNIIPFGIDSETENSITISGITTSNFTIGEEDSEIKTAVTWCTLLVNGKAICLYVYKDFKELNDLEWTRQTAKSWEESILSANSVTQSVGVSETILDILKAGLGKALVILFFTVVISICYALYYLFKTLLGKTDDRNVSSNQYTLGINPSYNIKIDEKIENQKYSEAVSDNNEPIKIGQTSVND